MVVALGISLEMRTNGPLSGYEYLLFSSYIINVQHTTPLGKVLPMWSLTGVEFKRVATKVTTLYNSRNPWRNYHSDILPIFQYPPDFSDLR